MRPRCVGSTRNCVVIQEAIKIPLWKHEDCHDGKNNDKVIWPTSTSKGNPSHTPNIEQSDGNLIPKNKQQNREHVKQYRR